MIEKRANIFEKEYPHFIEQIIKEDLIQKKHDKIILRFPPEPNGYLHIGHAKAICLNFGLAADNEGFRCHLRMDDTNPEKEDQEYVDAIIADIQWLGFDWGRHLYYASDYYERLYRFASELVRNGLAYVDQQSAEQIKKNRGTMKEPGINSPYRDRPIEENFRLFKEMRAGKHPEGSMVLRAKIDMSAGNINMRDPILYRIRFKHHQRTGDQWCIYPMYDFAHPLEDAIEKVTHSLCSLEFQDHRPLYDWVIDNTSVNAKPRQIEFARLNLNYTVMSKRKLKLLVDQKLVDGWDDPRMPTISGMRRRGFSPAGIRSFCDYISIGKKDTIIDYGLLEQHVRDDLNQSTKRVMAVLEPIKVTLTNWSEDHIETIVAPFHPEDDRFGNREIRLSKYLYIEASDFLEDPPSPKKWFRLGPGRSVRLRYGPIITCDEFVKDADGKIIELKCRFIENSFNGLIPEGTKKPKGIIHWVSRTESRDIDVRLYDRLFAVENPEEDKERDFTDFINPNSLQIITAKVEPYIAKAKPGDQFQFERLGYFIADSKDSQIGQPIFNRTLSLKSNF